jgi:hypothetical protein
MERGSRMKRMNVHNLRIVHTAHALPSGISASCIRIADGDASQLTGDMDDSDAIELPWGERIVVVANVVAFSANDFRAQLKFSEYLMIGRLWPYRSGTVTLIRPTRDGMRTRADEHGYFVSPRPSASLFRLVIGTATETLGTPWILHPSDTSAPRTEVAGPYIALPVCGRDIGVDNI